MKDGRSRLLFYAGIICVLLCCQISVNHRYVYNAIYDNLAFAINQSTIFLKSAKFDFHDNFLVNPYNLYEMVTFNRTKYVLGIRV